jgi:septal ring factor EnvC (AmiA/AmiB activator)
MKTIFLTFLFSGMLFIGNKVAKAPEVSNDDKEFEQLMSDFHKTMEQNKVVQSKADSTKDQIIIETTKEISKLSTENKQLKAELNEVKAQLDNVVVDTGRSFELLPISHN